MIGLTAKLSRPVGLRSTTISRLLVVEYPGNKKYLDQEASKVGVLQCLFTFISLFMFLTKAGVTVYTNQSMFLYSIFLAFDDCSYVEVTPVPDIILSNLY